MDAREKEALQKEREAVYRQRMVETIKLDPKVPFVLGEKEHILVFNNRAIKEILAATGINLLTTALTSEQMMTPDVLAVLVLAGLRTHSPDLTIEEVDLTLTTRHTLYYQTQIAKGMELFYPDLSDLPVPSEEKAEDAPDPSMPALALG